MSSYVFSTTHISNHKPHSSLMALDLAPFLAIFIPFLLLLFCHLHHRRYNLPPGPKPWPIIGNLNLIGSIPHHSLHELSQKYGPILHLKLGLKNFIVVSSSDVAKAFLKTHGNTFSSRPETTSGKYTAYNYSDILWAPYGPHLRQARKICFTYLFSQKSIESSEHIRKEEMKIILKELFISSDKLVILKDYLYYLNLNIISRMVLGKKYVEKGQSGFMLSWEEFKTLVDEFFLLNGGFGNVGEAIPLLNFLDLQGYIKRMKDFGKKFDRFLEHVLNEHEERRKGAEKYVATDFLDVLLQLAEDSSLEVKLHRHCIKALTQDILLATIETSAMSIEWAMSELLRNPKYLRKATEELDRVIEKERWVEERDLVNLPYMECITKESMRLHPGASILPPRVATTGNTKVLGFDIPEGTQVLVNAWAIGRDPTVWENPNEFYPERFIGKDIDMIGPNIEFLPFGAGRRICPGYPLALKVVQMTLANLVHGFSWSLPNHMKEVDLNMEETFRFTGVKKQPLEVFTKPRLSSHIYL